MSKLWKMDYKKYLDWSMEKQKMENREERERRHTKKI